MIADARPGWLVLTVDDVEALERGRRIPERRGRQSTPEQKPRPIPEQTASRLERLRPDKPRGISERPGWIATRVSVSEATLLVAFARHQSFSSATGTVLGRLTRAANTKRARLYAASPEGRKKKAEAKRTKARKEREKASNVARALAEKERAAAKRRAKSIHELNRPSKSVRTVSGGAFESNRRGH